MSKNIILGIVATAILVLIVGVVYYQIATNNKPDSVESIVKDLHDVVTPSSHRNTAQ